MAVEPPHSGGAAADGRAELVMANNETVRSFLLSAGEDRQHLTDELQELASSLSSRGSVPYRSLRSIWSALPPAGRPALRRLLTGADFIFFRPKARERSEELEARSRKLAEMAERREYEELVKDIAPKKKTMEPFSSYKYQLGFGLHVVLIMFTGYLVGFAAFRALFNHSFVMNTAGGIFGLVCGMLLETVLFIIRTSKRDLVSSRSMLN